MAKIEYRNRDKMPGEEEKKFEINPNDFSDDQLTHIQSFVCPITQEIMMEPVVTKYGHSYEKSAIVFWVSKHGSCPLTNQQLKLEEIFPNFNLKHAIITYFNDLKE